MNIVARNSQASQKNQVKEFVLELEEEEEGKSDRNGAHSNEHDWKDGTIPVRYI